jgi:hypothetical protein
MITLKVKIPVWHVVNEEGKPYLTSDGIIIRALSRAEATAFVDVLKTLSPGLYELEPLKADEVEISVDVELTPENVAELRRALGL